MDNSQHIAVPFSLMDDTLTFVALSSFLAKRATDELEMRQAQQRKAAELSATLPDLLIQAGLIDGRQKQAAAAMLGGHPETVQLLTLMIEKFAELNKAITKSGADLGVGVNEDGNTRLAPTTNGHGSDTSLDSPFIGGRYPHRSESDKVLMRAREFMRP